MPWGKPSLQEHKKEEIGEDSGEGITSDLGFAESIGVPKQKAFLSINIGQHAESSKS